MPIRLASADAWCWAGGGGGGGGEEGAHTERTNTTLPTRGTVAKGGPRPTMISMCVGISCLSRAS